MKTKSISIKATALIFALLITFASVMTGCGSKKTGTGTGTAISESSDKETSSNSESVAEVPTVSPDVDTSGAVKIAIDVKDYGTIKAELYPKVAPITVENFKKLVSEKFYDGLTFHRIMEGFMIQGGDPEGNGTGGSKDTIKGEFATNGVTNNLSHTRGVISMARSQLADSASSQFFIVQADSTFLDGNYAAFGLVTEGIEIVDKICADSNPTDNNGTIEADKQPVINSITLE